MKKKDCSFFQTFAKKRTSLFEDFLLLRIVHKKYKIVSLSHREHTKHEYTFLVFVRAPHF